MTTTDYILLFNSIIFILIILVISISFLFLLIHGNNKIKKEVALTEKEKEKIRLDIANKEHETAEMQLEYTKINRDILERSGSSISNLTPQQKVVDELLEEIGKGEK